MRAMRKISVEILVEDWHNDADCIVEDHLTRMAEELDVYGDRRWKIKTSCDKGNLASWEMSCDEADIRQREDDGVFN